MSKLLNFSTYILLFIFIFLRSEGHCKGEIVGINLQLYYMNTTRNITFKLKSLQFMEKRWSNEIK